MAEFADMAMKSGALEKWRNYFRTATSDIFDIIEHAIMVAASDCPKEFRLRRDRIAEKLFSCKLTRCSGCDRVELATPGDDEDEGCKSGFDRDGFEFGAGGSKESKVNSSRDDHGEMNMNQISNYSYGEAEALTDEIDEENQIVGEVLRIKEMLDNCQDESDSVLFDSLRRLQLMALSVETLQTTEIGKAVNALRKHGLKQIRHLARKLVEGWMVMVDEWANATEAIAVAEGTPDSVNPSTVDEEEEEEEGLPSPPLDEGAFFATETTSMELSQFFDGMDDDGNPRNCVESNKNHENCRKPSRENEKNNPKQKQQLPSGATVTPKDKRSEPMKKEDAVIKKQATVVIKSNRLSRDEFRSRRPTKLSGEQKVNNETKSQKKSDEVTILKRPSVPDKLRCSDEAAVQVKFEASKRKLQERYQQAENAKRQRTIQLMELHDLPKQGLGHKNPHYRPGNHNNRHGANGRR